MPAKKRIAVFASGKGTNTQAVIAYFKKHPFIEVALICSNRKKAGVINIAEKESIPCFIFSKEQLFNGEVCKKLLASSVDLIVLAGFLLKVPDNLIKAFENKIINIHPALLPKYGGKGMFGENVHRAVIDAGDKESGITIHFVNENYDEGKIILQEKCTIVTGEENCQSLAQKVQVLEHQFLPRTIEKLLMP